MHKTLMMLLTLVLGAPAMADPTTDSARRLLEPLLPAGSNIAKIKASGTRIEIRGHAANAASVSTFLRSIDSSTALERPELMEIAVDGSQHRFVISLSAPCLANGSCGGPAPAPAQTVYKCTVDGVVTFQATPCPQ